MKTLTRTRVLTPTLCFAAWIIGNRGFIASAYTDGRSANRGNSGEPGDLVCGPRCAQFILRHYGIDADLIDLVREIQWPTLEDGATLAAVDQALRARGVHTRALRMGPTSRLSWSHPVLLHLTGETAGGHFVVWLPDSTENTAHVWIGLAGVQSGRFDSLRKRMSGAILLTSPTPIESTQWEAQDTSRTVFAILSFSSIAMLAVLGCWIVQRRRSRATQGSGVRLRQWEVLR